MTTLIIKHCLLEHDKDVLRQYLEARGHVIKRFEFVHWIQSWLKDPAGCFWGRKVLVPKVGDICMAKVKPCVQKEASYIAKGHLMDFPCVVRGSVMFGPDVKVRVVSVEDKSVSCVVADELAEITRKLDIRYKTYYSAAGVTGALESVPWRNDIVNLARIFPNEILPTGVLAGFERIVLPPSVDCEFDVYLEAGKDDKSGYVLAVACGICHGQARMACTKCGGSGRYQPICRKCDGSGQWKYGGECNMCHGAGHLDYECIACGGSGERECWVCHGTGVRRVWVDYKTGDLSISGKDKERIQVDADDVFLWRERDGDRVKMSGTWNVIEQIVKAAVDGREVSSRRADELKQLFANIQRGLDEKILHKDTTQVPPVHVVLNAASLDRKRGRVIYLLKEKGESAWKKAHNEPYPKGTLLKIDGFEVPPDSTICYEGYRPASRELVVSFPQQMDVSSLQKRDLEIRSAEMRPAEARQREYLQRWMADSDSPIYRAMVCGCLMEPIKGVELFNKKIQEYPRQRLAVEYGVSDAPLFLLKGPPGTGKTTIIVEIIRQAIHRGQRVLLTSQTHQAVENVLEKLSGLVENGEDKTIRMVHYTAQEGKASELAKRYSDGSGTAEIKAIRAYVAECLGKIWKRIAKTGDPSVMESLKRLCDEGAECARRVEGAQDERRAAQALFDRELKVARAEADAELASLIAALDGSVGDEIRRSQRDLAAKEKALVKETAAVSEHAKVVAAKQKRVESLSKGPWGKVFSVLSVFSDNFDVEAVRKQLETAKTERQEAVHRCRALSEETFGIQDLIAARQHTYAQTKTAIEQAAASKCTATAAAIETRRNCSLAEHDQAVGRVREAALRQIEKLNRLLGDDFGLTADSQASDWTRICRRLEQDRQHLNDLQSYLSEWEKTLVEKPEVVGRFLNSQSNVFLATCVGVGGWRSLMDGTYARRFEDVDGVKPDRFFDLVIVDEAGHATCAETIIPLSMGRRAILIGDDKQLPPIDDADLETESLFSTLWEDQGCKVPRVMLDTQFRMHPDIADFVSATFYNGELKNGVSESDRAFQFSSFNRPVCLLSTSNQPNHYENWKKPSFENPLEARYVKEILDALIAHCNEHGARGETVSVAVITPYAEQVSLIRQYVKPLIGASGSVQITEDDIASVDKFQGGERDVVIASFVRSPKPKVYAPKLTFVQDLKRMNVAFSRPRRMLILVGDIKALSTELGDEDGRKAFAAFHCVVRSKGLEVLAWERGRRDG